jgi:hypothetical protein
MRALLGVLAVAGFGVCVVGGCGGDSSNSTAANAANPGSAPTNPAGSSDAPRSADEAVKRLVKAWNTHDAAAVCALYTAPYRRQAVAGYGSCEQAFNELFAADSGTPWVPRPAKVTGDRAGASAVTTTPTGTVNDSLNLVRIHGRWFFTDSVLGTLGG